MDQNVGRAVAPRLTVIRGGRTRPAWAAANAFAAGAFVARSLRHDGSRVGGYSRRGDGRVARRRRPEPPTSEGPGTRLPGGHDHGSRVRSCESAGRLPWPARNSHRQVGVRAQVLERGREPTRPGSSERRRARVPNVPTCHSANSASAPQPSAGVEIPTSIIRARSADRPEAGCDRRTSATPAARGRSRRRLRGPGWSPSCPRSPGRSSARCGRPAQQPSATG